MNKYLINKKLNWRISSNNKYNLIKICLYYFIILFMDWIVYNCTSGHLHQDIYIDIANCLFLFLRKMILILINNIKVVSHPIPCPVWSTIINHCVCRVRNSVTDELVVEAFKAKWRLRYVIGKPVSGTFWRDNESWKFAISRRIVKGDSVASLAVKFSQALFVYGESMGKDRKDLNLLGF